MDMRRTERLFERFRAKGDLRALGEVFDRTAPELLALATHLTRELADAEDVLQATFVTAIERAGTWDRARRLVPWLCGILVNHAKAVHRREAGRASRGEAAHAFDAHADHAHGDPAHGVAAGEVEALIGDALRSLPARDREVLERHLVCEERAVDIARALGRAPGTVRMQIHRGLERLRRALPPGTVAGLVPALAPELVSRGCVAVREAVLSHARAHGLSAAGVAGAGSAASLGVLTVGGAIVSTKLVMSVLGVCGAAVLGWFLLGPPSRVEVLGARETAREVERSAELVLASSSERAQRAVFESDAAALDAREALAPASAAEEPAGPPPGWYVVGRVLGLRDADDPRDVTINVHCFEASEHDFLATMARADGTFEVDVTPIVEEVGTRAQELLCSANHPLYVSGNGFVEPSPAELRRTGDERTEWSVELTPVPASGVIGRVLIPGGDPRDVELRLVPVDEKGAVSGEGRDLGCEEDGSYDMRWLEHGDFALVACADGFLSTGRRVTIPPQTIVEVAPLELVRGDVSIEGRVVLPAGRATTCFVHAFRVGGGGRIGRAAWDGERATPSLQVTEVGADGRFVLRGLVPGRWTLLVDRLDDVLRVEAPPPEEESEFDEFSGAFTDSVGTEIIANVPSPPGRAVLVDAPTSGVVLSAGAAWLDVVATSDGAPLANARIEVEPAGGFDVVGSRAESGRLTFLLESPGDYVVSAEAPGYERATRRVPITAEEHAVALALVPSATGAFVLVADKALRDELAAVKVVLERDGSDEPIEEVLQLAGGTARIDGLAPGRWSAEVEPDGSRFGPYYDCYLQPVRYAFEVEPGAVVRRAYAPPAGGRARIVVEGFDEEVTWVTSTTLGPDGEPIEVRFVTRTYQGNVIRVGASVGAIDAHGTSTTYPNLAPGLHQLVLEQDGWDVEPVAFNVVPGETVDVRVRAQRRR